MKIFDIKDAQVIVNPEILVIPAFYEVWKNDKSKNKETAFMYFTFIYHLCDYGSPYSNYSEEKRLHSLLTDILKAKDINNYKIPPHVSVAIDEYRELTVTPKKRLFDSCKKKLDALADYMDETAVTDESLKSVLEMFNKLSSTISNFDKLEEAVKKEHQSVNINRRGSKATAMFEE